MSHPFEIELTAAEIVILTDLIYEQAPQIWSDGEWCCLQPVEFESGAETLMLVDGEAWRARVMPGRVPHYASPCSTA